MKDIKIKRTNTHVFTLTFKDKSTQDPINITGYEIWFTVKKNFDTDQDDSSAIIQKQAVITDAPNGQATISLTSGDTTQTPDTYQYDIKYIENGNVKTLGVAKFIIEPVVTNTND